MALMKCPDCGYVVINPSQPCTRCGHLVSAMTTTSNDDFGITQSSYTPVSLQAPDALQSKTQGGSPGARGKIYIALLVFSIILLVSLGGIYYGVKAPAFSSGQIDGIPGMTFSDLAVYKNGDISVTLTAPPKMQINYGMDEIRGYFHFLGRIVFTDATGREVASTLSINVQMRLGQSVWKRVTLRSGTKKDAQNASKVRWEDTAILPHF